MTTLQELVASVSGPPRVAAGKPSRMEAYRARMLQLVAREIELGQVEAMDGERVREAVLGMSIAQLEDMEAFRTFSHATVSRTILGGMLPNGPALG